ncbi:MAG: antiporter NhaP, partial [Candidatus Hydrogenedentota bacterium]|jgi:hypothetical protein
MKVAGYADADRMVPVMFLVIAVTVALYGLTAPILARRLGVTQPDPRGILIAGAHRFSRDLAKCLKDAGIQTMLVDRNWSNVSMARIAGLNVVYGDILDESLVDEAVSKGMGRLMALTPNDKVNCLAAIQYAECFEHKNVYQLPLHKGAEAGLSGAEMPGHLLGRILFKPELTYESLQELMDNGYRIKLTTLSNSFTIENYHEQYGGEAIPLMVIRDAADTLVTAGDKPKPAAGAKLLGLVPPVDTVV